MDHSSPLTHSTGHRVYRTVSHQPVWNHCHPSPTAQDTECTPSPSVICLLDSPCANHQYATVRHLGTLPNCPTPELPLGDPLLQKTCSQEVVDNAGLLHGIAAGKIKMASSFLVYSLNGIVTHF